MCSPCWFRWALSSILCGSALACSAPGPMSGAGPIDAGPAVDDASPPAETEPPPTTPRIIENGTTGSRCASDDDCNRGGVVPNVCSKGGFSGNALYPTPICISTECDPGEDIEGFLTCDDGTGICLSAGLGGVCLPDCSFGDSTDAPVGCVGKNKCNLLAWGRDSDGRATGLGYCFGGCTTDADCPVGNDCQVEEGLCVKSVIAYTKTPGTPCTEADARAPATCNCVYSRSRRAGYCVDVCYFGETTCDPGFTCDVGLPASPIRDNDVVFAVVPRGLAGYCLKDCATDADCEGLSAYCEQTAGTGRKTCQLGRRPCVRDEQCPSTQACFGVTEGSYGRCS